MIGNDLPVTLGTNHPKLRDSISILASKLNKPDKTWYQDEVCQRRLLNHDYVPHADSIHWLLWSLGCRDKRILNREESTNQMKWSKGKDLKFLLQGSQRLTAWKPFRLGSKPELGDLVISGIQSRGEKEMASIFLGETQDSWLLAHDCTTNKGIYETCVEQCKLKGDMLIFKNMNKIVLGFIDLSKINYEGQLSL